MPFSVSSVLASELEKVHRFHLSLVLDGQIERFLFPNGASHITVAAFAEQDRKLMHDPKSTSRPVVVKDSETGELVSYALWKFFTEGNKGKEEKSSLGDEWPSDVNKEPLDILHKEGTKKREDLMEGKPHAYLAALVTSPNHRHRGAASLLIEWGLSLADSHHLPAFLEAPPENQSLYQKHGFQQVSTGTVDLTRWGIPYTEAHSLMVRTTSPLPPPFTISISPWLTNADFASFPSIEDQAFQTSPSNDIMFGPLDSIDTSADHAERTTEALAYNATDPTSHIVKAFRPATGEILAYGQWHMYRSHADARIHPRVTCPPQGNAAFIAHFFGTLIRTQEHHMRDVAAYVFMRLIVVRPAAQRQGLGTAILRWGLDRADRQGLRAWIDASPKGIGLYRRMGWIEVERFVVRLGEWGGEGEDVTVSMVRMPVGRGD